MTISVIMSTYCKEHPAYLDAALKSVWTDQTRKPDEIVLVEDGPLPDELENVVSKWKMEVGDVLKVISKPENEGLGSALNDAVSASKGDLLARMDSDDISLPGRFELQEKYMTEHPCVDILGGSTLEFNDSGMTGCLRIYPPAMEDVLNTIHRMSPLSHPTVMFRRRVFAGGLQYSTNPNDFEDLKLWFDALKAGYVINNLPEVILHFRRNDYTIRRRRSRAWNEFVIYNQGIYGLNGLFSIKYLYPVARLVFRLMPKQFIRYVYDTEWFRNKLSKR